MPTVTLYPGVVSLDGAPTTDYGLTGSGALWKDASDSTYLSTKLIKGTGVLYPGMADLDLLALPGGVTVTDITVNVRAASEALGAGGLGALHVAIRNATDGFDAGVGPTFADTVGQAYGLIVSTSGVITDFAHSLDPADLAVPFPTRTPAGIASDLAAGCSIYVHSTSNVGMVGGETVKHRVYELSVDVTYSSATFAPPLRLTNRDDVFSSAPSLTRSRSQQGTNSPTAYL